MAQFVLTARYTYPLSNGGTIEQGRQVFVSVNSPGTTSSNLFNTEAGKKAVSFAFGQQMIPANSSFMSYAKWDIKPYTPRF